MGENDRILLRNEMDDLKGAIVCCFPVVVGLGLANIARLADSCTASACGLRVTWKDRPFELQSEPKRPVTSTKTFRIQSEPKRPPLLRQRAL